MGVDPSMLSMSLVGVVCQRLMRRICQNRKMEYRESPEVLEELQLAEALLEAALYKGAGCEACDDEGYRGRVAVCEFWEPTGEVKDVISNDPDDRKIRSMAFGAGLKPLAADAIREAAFRLTVMNIMHG